MVILIKPLQFKSILLTALIILILFYTEFGIRDNIRIVRFVRIVRILKNILQIWIRRKEKFWNRGQKGQPSISLRNWIQLKNNNWLLFGIVRFVGMVRIFKNML